jgi:hypothetical protein
VGAVADMKVTLNFWQQVDSSSWVKALDPSRLFGHDHARGVRRYKQSELLILILSEYYTITSGVGMVLNQSSGPVCTNIEREAAMHYTAIFNPVLCDLAVMCISLCVIHNQYGH